jgi:hypothetical protein
VVVGPGEGTSDGRRGSVPEGASPPPPGFEASPPGPVDSPVDAPFVVEVVDTVDDAWRPLSPSLLGDADGDGDSLEADAPS